MARVGVGALGRKVWLFLGFSGHGHFQLFGGLQNGKIWLCGPKKKKVGAKTVACSSLG